MKGEREKNEKKRKYAGQFHIYGGVSHKTYLGCISCSSNDQLSIWNANGVYGKTQSIMAVDNTENIWNIISPFGSKTSNLSPWCKTASNPPAIVDFDGKFYGYFTANQTKEKRADVDWINKMTDDPDNVDYEGTAKSTQKN